MVFDGLSITGALADFAILLVASFGLTYILRTLDPDSIISFRRTFGLLLVPNSVWAILVMVGTAFSAAVGGPRPAFNEFILGSFFAWSLELIIINGAFVPSTLRSLCISAIQPMTVLVLTWTFLAPGNPDVVYATVSGFLVLGAAALFLLKFKTFKTQDVGISSLQTFQSFLKSWVSQKPADLEGYFTMYSRDEQVTTKAVIFRGSDRVAVVLPGVHPGPFFPVGSYNLSELIHQELRKDGFVPLILHGIGGHERNLPTNDATKNYASAVAATAASTEGEKPVLKMRGPYRAKLGVTNITILGFGNMIIAFLTNAPYNTDDLEPAIIDDAASISRELGLDLMLVDAHNSIGGENTEQPRTTGEDWRIALSAIRDSPEYTFDVGVAHSSEIPFEHGSDISDGGIGVLVLHAQSATYALVASDSNNVTLGLREVIIDELKKEGVELIELCTSDTHNSAARHLTDRGYLALGEDTSHEAILAAIKKLEKLAETKLSRGTVTLTTSVLTVPLIGEKSLHDFATLTKETLDFSKTYAKAALVFSLLLCALALLY